MGITNQEVLDSIAKMHRDQPMYGHPLSSKHATFANNTVGSLFTITIIMEICIRFVPIQSGAK